MMAVHERLGHHDAGLARGLGDRVHLVQGHGQRLLAEDVFAGLGRLDGPRGVEAVGQRDVDDVDVRVSQHRLVAAERAGDAPFGGVGLRVGQVAAGDRGQPVARRCAQRGDQRPVDVGRAQQAPTQDAIGHEMSPLPLCFLLHPGRHGGIVGEVGTE